MPSASGSVLLNGTSTNVGTTLTVTATQTSQNVTANTSVITLTYTIASGRSWGAFYTPSNTYMTPTIDGVEGTRTKVTNPADLNAGQSAVVLTTTHTVNHNSDGTKTVGISVFYDDRPGGGATTKTVSTFYLTLDTIPRASTLSVSATQTMGTSYRFTINRASSSFRHKITYIFGNASGTVLDTTTSDVTTKDWTPPTSLASQGVVTGGNKTSTIYYYLYTYSGGTQIGAVENRVTLSIPSADSLVSVTASQTMGTAYTFTCGQNASNYTHKLNWSFGNTSGTDNTAFTTSKSFTPSTSLGSQIPSSNSGEIYYSITTYNGSTVVGTSAQKKATLSIPSGAEPTFSFSASVTNGNSLGVAIVGYSTVAWSTTGVSAKYGATIASYSFSFAGVSSTDGTKSGVKLISGSAGGTSYTPTMTITDSRGKKTTHTASAVTVYTYSAPVIISSYAYRSDANGNRKDDGTYVTKFINAKTDYSCGGKNKITTQERWRLTTGSWSAWGDVPNNQQSTSANWDSSKSYQIERRVIDSLGTPKSVTYPIPTAFVTEVSKAGGKAVGFFGYPQEDGLTVYGDGHIKSSDADPVLEWNKTGVNVHVPVNAKSNFDVTEILSSKITKGTRGFQELQGTAIQKDGTGGWVGILRFSATGGWADATYRIEVSRRRGRFDELNLSFYYDGASYRVEHFYLLPNNITNTTYYRITKDSSSPDTFTLWFAKADSYEVPAVVDVKSSTRNGGWNITMPYEYISTTPNGQNPSGYDVYANGFAIMGHSSAFGAVISKNTTWSFGSGWSSALTINVPVGNWYIGGWVKFPNNSSGYRIISLRNGSVSANWNKEFVSNANQAVNGNEMPMQIGNIFYFDTATDVNLCAFNSSGNTFSVPASIYAYRLL